MATEAPTPNSWGEFLALPNEQEIFGATAGEFKVLASIAKGELVNEEDAQYCLGLLTGEPLDQARREFKRWKPNETSVWMDQQNFGNFRITVLGSMINQLSMKSDEEVLLPIATIRSANLKSGLKKVLELA